MEKIDKSLENLLNSLRDIVTEAELCRMGLAMKSLTENEVILRDTLKGARFCMAMRMPCNFHTDVIQGAVLALKYIAKEGMDN